MSSGVAESRAGPAAITVQAPALSSPPSPGGGVKPSGFLRELLLPALLTLVPLLILFSGSAWERDRRLEERRRQWLDGTAQAARRLFDASTPEFWVEWSFRRAVKTAGRALDLLGRQGRGIPGNPEVMVRVLSMARQRTRLEGVPDFRLWALAVPSDQEKTGSGDLLKAPGLESDLRYVMVRLLREIGRNGTSEPPDFERGQWSRMLEQLFGYGVTGDLFMADMRGKAFPVTFQGRTRTACWDLVPDGRGGTVVLLAVSPMRPEMVRSALRLSIRHWARIGRGSRARPFIVPFSRLGAKGINLEFTHPSLDMARWREIIGGIQRQMKLTPGIHLTREQQRALDDLPSYVVGGKRFGQIRLPVRHLEQVMETGQGRWWYKLFPLAPKAMSIGGFLAPAPQPETGPIGRWAFRLAMVWVGGWSGLILMTVLFGRPPTVPVRASLILWFLALVLLPVSQGVVTGAKFSADLRRNLLEEGFSRLRTGIDRLEASSLQLNAACLLASREVTGGVASDSRAGAELYKVQFASQPMSPFFERVWSHFQERGLGLSGVLVFGHQGFVRSRFIEGTAHRIASATQYLSFNLVQAALNAEITPVLRKRGIEPTIAPLGEIQRQRPEMLRLDAVYSFGVGPKQLIGFLSRLLHEGEVYHFLMVFWEQDRLHRRWLADWVHNTPLPAGQRIKVFRAGGGGVETIASGGAANGLEHWVGGREDEERRWETGDRLVMSLPSRSFPGMRYVIAMSSDWIKERLSVEERNRAVQAMLLIFLVGLAGWLLSEWLASPIESMTDALRKVAAGNVGIRLGVHRSDELGDAAGALDTMIGWLRERVKMGRFVAPQVLDVVAGGDLSRVMQGSAREVVVLVSDLRSFTTISETRTPEEVFQLLNGHLERMTAAIQTSGGVIDRFIGDAIQAVFYVEEADDRSRERAIRSAIQASRAMMRAHSLYNQERLAAGSFPYEIGIGLDLGRVVTGVLGDPESRLDFTVLGDVIRSAGDLEAASKQGRRTRIICSQAIRRYIPDIPMGSLGDDDSAWELEDLGGESFASPGNTLPAGLGTCAPGEVAEPQSDDSTPGFRKPSSDRLSVEPVVPAESPDGRSRDASGLQRSGSPASSGEFLTGRQKPVALGWVRSELRHRGAAAHFPRPVGRVAFLLMWFLPVVLIGAAYWSLCDEEGRRLREIEKGRIAGEAKLLEKVGDARAILSWYCQNLLGEVGRKGREGTLTKAVLAERFSQAFRQLRAFLPSLDWSVIDPHRQRRTDRFTVSDKDFRLVEMAGERYLLASEAVPTFAIISLSQLFNGRPLNSRLDLFSDRGLVDIFGAKGHDKPFFEEVLFSRWGEVTIRGRPCLMCWDLLAPTPEWKATEYPPFRVNHGDFTRDPPLSTYDRITHGILLFLDPVDLTPGVVRKLLAANFRSRGTTVHIFTDGGSPSAGEPATGLETVTAETRLRLDGDFRVRLSRTVPAGGRFLALGRLLIGLGLLWIAVFLAFVRIVTGNEDGSPGRSGRLGLTARLATAFVFVLLPAIALAGLAAERRQFERETRLESDLRQDMERRFERFDSGLSIWSGVFGALLQRELSLPGFLSSLKRLDRMPEKSQAGIPILERLARRMIQCGLLLGSPRIVGRRGQGWELIENRSSTARDLMWEFQYLVSKRLLAAYNPGVAQEAGERSANQDLLIGAQIEELTSILRIVLDPSHFAGLFFSSFSIARYADLRADSTLFVRHIGWEEAPAFLFNVSWLNENHLLHHVMNWSEEIVGMLPGNAGIAIGETGSPFLQLDTPAIRPARHRITDGITFDRLYRPMDRRPGVLNSLVCTSRETLTDRIGEGDEQTLFMARPLRVAINTNIMGQIPIGTEFRKERLQLRKERIWLGIMLLFAILLALATARRFIGPVLSLTVGTRAITAGDFSIRLPVDREDEFGDLARAFNAMAAGVQEGRLLSRFVSDSVRQTARDEEREAAARRGEAVRAVVLFAGLSRFKELLAGSEPGRLIESLNRYLETMAREVRLEGGMIDKFIGDKVLAVFFVRDHGGEEAAMAAAVRAARAMQGRMADLRSELGSDLGIGLVAGTVLAGIMGTAEVRLESTVIGDPVNLASRLCDAARGRAGGSIVAEAALVNGLRSSPDPAIAAEAAGASRLDLTKVKGKTREIEVFAL